MYLKIGDIAPEFNLPNQNGEQVKLSDFNGSKLLIWFYPKASTPG
jgi:peroxiredoxin Q/BCP